MTHKQEMLLNQIRELDNMQRIMAERRSYLVREFGLAGPGWREVAEQQGKIFAVRMYKDLYGCDIKKAMEAVENYLGKTPTTN